MKKLCQKRRFLMAQNHVWRYTLRLFYTFGLFEKNRKIDAKMEPKSRGFWSKMRPWAPKGRLILPFWWIFENLKNRWFFDVTLGFEKSTEIHNWGGLGGNCRSSRVPVGGSRGGIRGGVIGDLWSVIGDIIETWSDTLTRWVGGFACTIRAVFWVSKDENTAP